MEYGIIFVKILWFYFSKSLPLIKPFSLRSVLLKSCSEKIRKNRRIKLKWSLLKKHFIASVFLLVFQHFKENLVCNNSMHSCLFILTYFYTVFRYCNRKMLKFSLKLL